MSLINVFRLKGAFRLVLSQNRYTPSIQASYHSKEGIYGFKPEKEPSVYSVNDEVVANRSKNSNLYRFISAFREHGHKVAYLDPLKIMEMRSFPNLNPDQYGLSYNESYNVNGLMRFHKEEANLEEIVGHLKKIYASDISFEYTYVMHDEEREWLTDKIEQVMMEDVEKDDRIMLAEDMLKSQALDNFIGTKLPTVKRYGGEGAESMFAFFNMVLKTSSQGSIEDIQIGMPHRGRNNLLIGKCNLPAVILLTMMKGNPGEFGKEDEYRCSGDVLSHASASTNLKINGKEIHVSLLRNPSHLEAVNPVVMGKTRGRQQSLADGDYSSDPDARIGDKVMCVQFHGDAAFAGQGIVMETLAMSAVPHCNVGGTVHLIVNNQLGFTAPSDRSRSSMYCSDVMKMINAPVIHVNGDNPDAVMKASQIALDYREKFRKDVLVDLMCFRKWGHNELDDPTFTNPQMYQVISTKQSIPDKYASQVVNEKLTTQEHLDGLVSQFVSYLNEQLQLTNTYIPKADYLNKHWSGYQRVPATLNEWKTGVDVDLLKYIGAKSVTVPDDFNLHPHLKKTFVDARLKKLENGNKIDWATAEALAIGSLLHEGYNIRLCGQDVGRGTFSQRHAMFVDQQSNEMYIPFNSISSDQKAFYEISNSILSEEAVLGFEYGMSIESPTRLNIWEAQFGDFYNGAQIIIDTYVTSGDDLKNDVALSSWYLPVKWLQQSGMVMLLPHGFDGAGPEHSSSHVERYLQLCDSKDCSIDSDNVNIEVVVPTTPAQYFHLLRRQMVRNYRVPLIVVSPKIMLRLPDATSTLEEMSGETAFKKVIPDDVVNADQVKTVIFCSGQIYYNLARERAAKEAFHVAIVRLESLCPFPTLDLQNEMKKYKNASNFKWSQEEHKNMGAFLFVYPRFKTLVGCELEYCGKCILGVTTYGSKQAHQDAHDKVIRDSFQDRSQ